MVYNQKKKEKHEKGISVFICYNIVQKADPVCISTKYHPPKVYTLFGKKMGEKHRGEGEERTEVVNSERKKPVR